MLDKGKVGGIGIESLEEIGVFGAFVSLGDKSKKEGDLELGLGGIDTVEETVKFGIVKSSFELGVGGSFFGEEFVGIFTGFLIVLSIISIETGSCASESTREGIGDGA